MTRALPAALASSSAGAVPNPGGRHLFLAPPRSTRKTMPGTDAGRANRP
jgi:hypothetical protein